MARERHRVRAAEVSTFPDRSSATRTAVLVRGDRLLRAQELELAFGTAPSPGSRSRASLSPERAREGREGERRRNTCYFSTRC